MNAVCSYRNKVSAIGNKGAVRSDQGRGNCETKDCETKDCETRGTQDQAEIEGLKWTDGVFARLEAADNGSLAQFAVTNAGNNRSFQGLAEDNRPGVSPCSADTTRSADARNKALAIPQSGTRMLTRKKSATRQQPGLKSLTSPNLATGMWPSSRQVASQPQLLHPARDKNEMNTLGKFIKTLISSPASDAGEALVDEDPHEDAQANHPVGTGVAGDNVKNDEKEAAESNEATKKEFQNVHVANLSEVRPKVGESRAPQGGEQVASFFCQN